MLESKENQKNLNSHRFRTKYQGPLNIHLHL